MPVPDNVYLFHITSVNNLPGIAADGGLHCNRALMACGTTPTSIAYGHTQGRRSKRVVPCAAGGSLHDYVPFYFGPRPPMLYAIHKGNVEGCDEGQERIVYLVTRLRLVEEAGHPYAFTDRHAVLALAQFYERRTDLHHVDFDIMQSTFWNDVPKYPDRKERRQAEFLIHDFVPLSTLGAVAAMNDDVAEEARAHLKARPEDLPVEDLPVIVRRKWYH